MGVYEAVGWGRVRRSLSERIGTLGPCRFGRLLPTRCQVSIGPGAGRCKYIEDRAGRGEAIGQKTGREGRLVDSAVAPWLHVTADKSHEDIPACGSGVGRRSRAWADMQLRSSVRWEEAGGRAGRAVGEGLVTSGYLRWGFLAFAVRR